MIQALQVVFDVVDIAIGAALLGFDSRADQIGRHRCDVSVLPRRCGWEIDPAFCYKLWRNIASI